MIVIFGGCTVTPTPEFSAGAGLTKTNGRIAAINIRERFITMFELAMRRRGTGAPGVRFQ